MSGELSGKHGIVTGSAQGIGKEIAEAFLRAGASVAVLDQDGEAAAAAAAEMGANTIAMAVDVTDAEAVERVFGEVRAAFGGIDFLVNNAGVRQQVPMLEQSASDWRRTIDVNLTGTFLCSQAGIRAMLQRGGGRIVNLASMAGELALRERAAYNASKAGIIALTKSIALEFGGRGIYCNALAPGVIETPLSSRYFEDEQMVTLLRENTPLRRWGQVGEVAAPAVFLCSDAASFVQGATLFVDGGWAAGKGY